MDVERIYLEGFRAADFGELRPNALLVEAILPPESQTKTAGGLYVPVAATEKILPTNATLYRVLKVGEVIPELLGPGVAVLWNLKPGDVVTLRSGAAEPMHPNLRVLVIDLRHVHMTVRDDALEARRAA